MKTRLDHLRDLRARIDLEIDREIAFQKRLARLGAQTKIAVTTRSDWTTQVILAAATHFGVTAEDVISDSRSAEVVDARHVAAWLLRQDGRSYPQVGAAMHRDHTTVMHGIKRVERVPELLAVAVSIRDDLTAASGAA